MRSRTPVFTLKSGMILLILGVLAIWTWLGLGSCHSDRVSVNPKDPQSPQFEYRQDQFALLSMMADDIQELERKKQYATIYDDYTSQEFKNGISRRRFLIMTNCVETYLGGLEEYDPHDLGFRREKLKGSDTLLDVLNRKVKRIQGTIDEQMVFIPNGLNFRLNGLYWIAKDKQFLQCVAESPQREMDGQPAAEQAATENAAGGEQKTGEQATPAISGTAAGETQKTSTSESEQNRTHEETSGQHTEGTSEQGGTEATPKHNNGESPVPSPVQPMKPAEVRKTTTLHARPAGAGAVIDQRPTPRVKQPPTPARETNPAPNQPPIPFNDPAHDSSQNHGKAVPLPIPPIKQNEPPTPSENH